MSGSRPSDGALPSILRMLCACLVALLGLVELGFGQETAPAPTLQPTQQGVSRLRIWGPEEMAGVVKGWKQGFLATHPRIDVEARLMGSATAVPGLYSGRADIALLGRENNVTDDNGFSRPKGYMFRRLELMNGSLDVDGKSAALAVLVHSDNPTSRLTLAQLAAIAGCERNGNASAPLTWGQLGGTGAWNDAPVRLYTYDTESGTGQFFLKVVLHNSRKLAWDRVNDYKDIIRPDGSIYPASEQIVDALKSDQYGIAVSNLRYVTAGMKVVAIARNDAGPFVLPARDTVIARTYPLGRGTFAFVDQPPGKPLDPNVKDFLRYVLSREGQAAVERDDGYLPLSQSDLLRQLQDLDE
jgi:phosphate transport system substrate-binding protein